MKQVAKLLIIDNDNKYLLMYRNDHPTFGDDPDLPGGTLEDSEQPLETMIREVQEEAGVNIAEDKAELLYRGTDYSGHSTEYTLYLARLETHPILTLSWEHKSYEWLTRDEFLASIADAKDSYMHMVEAVLKKSDV